MLNTIYILNYLLLCRVLERHAAWRNQVFPTYTHTHTHTFNGPLSRTTRVSRYQKGKTNLDFTEARDRERQWHQLGHMQVCTSLQTDNHANTSPLSFLQAGCPSCRPANSVKALKAVCWPLKSYFNRGIAVLGILISDYVMISVLIFNLQLLLLLLWDRQTDGQTPDRRYTLYAMNAERL